MRVMLLLYWIGSCVCWSGVGKKYEGNVIVMLCVSAGAGRAKKTCGRKKNIRTKQK